MRSQPVFGLRCKRHRQQVIEMPASEGRPTKVFRNEHRIKPSRKLAQCRQCAAIEFGVAEAKAHAVEAYCVIPAQQLDVSIGGAASVAVILRVDFEKIHPGSQCFPGLMMRGAKADTDGHNQGRMVPVLWLMCLGPFCGFGQILRSGSLIYLFLPKGRHFVNTGTLRWRQRQEFLNVGCGLGTRHSASTDLRAYAHGHPDIRIRIMCAGIGSRAGPRRCQTVILVGGIDTPASHPSRMPLLIGSRRLCRF